VNEPRQGLNGQDKHLDKRRDGEDGDRLLQELCAIANDNIGRLRHCTRKEAHFEKRKLNDFDISADSGLGTRLLNSHPISLALGFEGNAGIEGGAWPSDARDGDTLVFLRFAAGTVDLPLHVHEHSDRFIVIDLGSGLFHYVPLAHDPNELRSIIVRAGDVIMLTRGLLHTFTAPHMELVLLSYHAPFFAFDDERQFTIPETDADYGYTWSPTGVATKSARVHPLVH